LPEDNVDNGIVEMPENQFLPLTRNKSRSASSAFVVRQKFTDYFNTVGSVPWQADKVSRGNYRIHRMLGVLTYSSLFIIYLFIC
jgi:hypothetical protein